MVRNRADFFVSHAGADRAWAEWVAWQLTGAGYTVELDVWDWAAGRNFMLAMSNALERCDRVVALFSAAYFDRSRYTAEEWTAAALHGAGIGEGRLVPVRVEEVPAAQVPAVLRPLVYRDLFGVAEDEARQILLEAVAGPQRPDHQPGFPDRGNRGGVSVAGGSGPRLPDSMPQVWNIPARNPGFTGRDGLLVAVREQLQAGGRAVVQALQGMGGVGKTQLAAEYAHQFAGTYDLAWWIESEQAGLIGEQFAALAAELGCVQPDASAEVVRSAVLRELRARGPWLLVFDNAENPADIRPWLPGGSGHVLITSREHGWAEIAVPVEVDVLARPESVAILQNRVGGLGMAAADRLAAQLGDLPLAITQAAEFMAETGLSAAQYLDLLEARAGQILAQAAPTSYARSLAAVTQLIADRLAHEDPAAAELASLCAFLAPEPIPEDLFTRAPDALPVALAARTADPLAWRQTLAHMTRRSLARIDQRGLQFHRLTQAILRDRLTPAQATVIRACSEAILTASHPGRGPYETVAWPAWARLIPHLLAADLEATANSSLRRLTCGASAYLVVRGDARTAYDLTTRVYQPWRHRLGADHPHTCSIGNYLAWALRHMGRYAEARELDQDILVRRRRVLGEDHRDTLTSATHLALDLHRMGEVQAARDLDEDTLARKYRILGDDHHDTWTSIGNLAQDLLALGETQAAHDLDQDLLSRCRGLLGEDHPFTLECANSLASDLYALGRVQAAHDLDQETYARRRRLLGDDDRLTLISASHLARDLYALGKVHAARDLDQDTFTRCRRVLGDDNPVTLESASNLARDLRRGERPNNDT
jgi:hypothetical protein